MGGEGATFATSHPELREVVSLSCSPNAAGSYGKEYSATATHSDSTGKSTGALTASKLHSTNRDIYSVFNYDNTSSVWLLMNQYRLGPSALHSVQTAFLYQGIPKDQTVGVWALMPGEHQAVLPWVFTVLAVTDRRLCWACLCPSKDINSVTVR